MNETKFLFSDEEFLGIVNIILKVDSDWEDEEYKPITSMDDNFNIQGLDSLSVMMFFIWVSELFGIPESKIEKFMTQKVFTVRAVKDFVNTEATRTYTYAEAKEFAKRMFK